MRVESGYKLSTLTVKNASGTSYTLTAGSNGKYTFTMPAAHVSVTATFTATSSTTPKTGDDFRIVFWNSMIMTSMLGAATLLLNRKKFFGK